MIVIRLLLNGLLLFAPDSSTTNGMMALVVDGTKQEQINPLCFKAHQVRLAFPYVDPQECIAVAGCNAMALCECTPLHQDISLITAATPTAVSLNKTPSADLPPTNGGDFSYIVNIANLKDGAGTKYTLDPNYMQSSSLMDRLRFTFDSLTACKFAIREDETIVNAHSFAFRPIGLGGPGQWSQALGQSVMGKLKIPAASTAKLRFTDFAGGNVHDVTLRPTASAIEITLQNHRPAMMPDDPCEDGVGRDFGYLYDLLLPRTANWSDRPIPHVKFTRSKVDSTVEEAECSLHSKIIGSRPICPPGSVMP